jgi:hypothetical protein
MVRKKRELPKVLWLSSHMLVFEWEREVGEHFPWGYTIIGKKKVLVFAEEGKDLYFLDDGDYRGYSENDVLCYFCTFGINLGRSGYAPNCLLGKHCIGVKFCRDFLPGPSFGENKELDIGTRREMAEKVFPNIVWHRCFDCEYWNSKNVVTVAPDGSIYKDPDAAFCEVLGRKPERGYYLTCKSFEVSHDPERRDDFFRPQRKLREYIEELKMLERRDLGTRGSK